MAEWCVGPGPEDADGVCCLSPGGPAASSPASEGPSGLRRRILGCRRRGSQQMDMARPVCCCEASEPLIMRAGFSLLSLCLSSAPFVESPQTVPDYDLGSFISSVLSETFTKARKQTGSFVFIATQTAFPGSLEPKNNILRVGLFTVMQGVLHSAGPISGGSNSAQHTLPTKPWLQLYAHYLYDCICPAS